MRRGHEDYLTQALEEDQENRDPNSISVRGSGGGVGIGEDMSTMEQVGPFLFHSFYFISVWKAKECTGL